MSLREPRCLICGNSIDRVAPLIEHTVRKTEVCSDRCHDIYIHNPDENNGKAKYLYFESYEEADAWIMENT